MSWKLNPEVMNEWKSKIHYMDLYVEYVTYLNENIYI